MIKSMWLTFCSIQSHVVLSFVIICILCSTSALSSRLLVVEMKVSGVTEFSISWHLRAIFGRVCELPFYFYSNLWSFCLVTFQKCILVVLIAEKEWLLFFFFLFCGDARLFHLESFMRFFFIKRPVLDRTKKFLVFVSTTKWRCVFSRGWVISSSSVTMTWRRFLITILLIIVGVDCL